MNSPFATPADQTYRAAVTAARVQRDAVLSTSGDRAERNAALDAFDCAVAAANLAR